MVLHSRTTNPKPLKTTEHTLRRLAWYWQLAINVLEPQKPQYMRCNQLALLRKSQLSWLTEPIACQRNQPAGPRLARYGLCLMGGSVHTSQTRFLALWGRESGNCHGKLVCTHTFCRPPLRCTLPRSLFLLHSQPPPPPSVAFVYISNSATPLRFLSTTPWESEPSPVTTFLNLTACMVRLSAHLASSPSIPQPPACSYGVCLFLFVIANYCFSGFPASFTLMLVDDDRGPGLNS